MHLPFEAIKRSNVSCLTCGKKCRLDGRMNTGLAPGCLRSPVSMAVEVVTRVGFGRVAGVV